MLDISTELSDDLSINSDDTDILLTQSYRVTDYESDLINARPKIDNYDQRSSYFDSDYNNDIYKDEDLFSPEQSLLYLTGLNENKNTSPLNNNIKQRQSFENQESPISRSQTILKHSTRNSPSSVNYYKGKTSPNTRLSFENRPTPISNLSTENKTPIKAVSFEEDIIQTPIFEASLEPHETSITERNSSLKEKSPHYFVDTDSFGEIDAKVKEGQEILSRLLLGSLNLSKQQELSYDEASSKSVHLTNGKLNNQDHINKHDSINNQDHIANQYSAHLDAFDHSSSTDMQFFETITEPVYSSENYSMEMHSPEKRLSVQLSNNKVNYDTIKEPTNSPNHIYLMKINKLHDEIRCLHQDKNEQLDLIQEGHKNEILSLEESIEILKKQKHSLLNHVNQLKESLSQKNGKCVELQDLLHGKAKEVHQLTIKDNRERQALQKEVDSLRCREKELDKQVNDMEKAFDGQFKQIKELDDRFRKVKKENKEMIKVKDNEIIALHECSKKQSITAQSSLEKLKQEFDQQLKEAVEKEQIFFKDEINKLKDALHVADAEKCKLKKQFDLECDRFRINTEALKTANLKLKKDVDEYRKKIQAYQVSDHATINNLSDAENNQLKQKLLQHDKLFKTLTLELIEQNTKLAVITGSTKTMESSLSPKRNTKLSVLSDSMSMLKESLDDLRHFVLSLQQENQNLKKEQSFDEISPSSGNSPTSTKLLRHLQSRMQHLRKENSQLRGMHVNDSTNSTTSDVLRLENKVQELDISLQKSDIESQKNTHLLHQRTSELSKLQRILTQATKENLRLEKAHASLQTSTGLPSPLSMNKSSTIKSTSEKMIHKKSRGPRYPGTDVKKFTFSDEFVPWDVEFVIYDPVEFTSTVVSNQPVWADPAVRMDPEKFNKLDGNIDRRSFMGCYDVIDGYPRNPMGRTGMIGRGLLGKWGPNHAADPIVTRWSRDLQGNIKLKGGKPILEFIAIQRKDSNQWAIPGGMVDAGEAVSLTLKREFSEEALNSLDLNEDGIKNLKERIVALFQQGHLIYKGYVDDPRNTDQSWMETVAVNFHDDDGDCVGKLPLHSGDDAKDVTWITINKKLDLYASHIEFIRKTCSLHSAYFEE